jgi:stress response protein YsnF
MQGQCVVAVYSSRDNAEQAYRAVLGSGVPEDHVRLSNQERSVASADGTGAKSDGGSIWDWLFGSDVPEDDRRLYQGHMAKGGTALSVLVDAPLMADLDRVEGLLQQYNPVEMHEENVAGSTAESAGSGTAMGQAGYAAQGAEREQVIPLPEEELKVGKRATETVKHIRTYVVEEPVQKDVQLRDERTVIEKRPATGAATGQPMEREYEVRERHEEPVVQKDVRAGEELVVRKEAAERTERVADTVKKTKADVDKTGR